MSIRWRDPWLAVPVALAFVIGWALWSIFAPAPTLDPVPALLGTGQFEAAEANADAYLTARPDDARGHFLAAQAALTRPEAGEPEAARALKHLERARFATKPERARVEVYRGKALAILDDLDGAEAAWTAAVKLDARVPEAGWHLLDYYYLQGRTTEATALALQLHAVEPDPHDSVRLLLELVRQDIRPLSPKAIVDWFAPLNLRRPDDIHAALGLGRGLILDSRIDEGLALLRRTVDAHPDEPAVWLAFFSGMDDGGADAESWQREFARLPERFRNELRFARYAGRWAQERLDWNAAAEAYRRSAQFEPVDARLLYRLARALKLAGDATADQAERDYKDYKAAFENVTQLYAEAEAKPDLGYVHDALLYRRLGAARARMQRRDEAIAWHRLATVTAPGDDIEAREALKRLEER